MVKCMPIDRSFSNWGVGGGFSYRYPGWQEVTNPLSSSISFWSIKLKNLGMATPDYL